MSDANETLDPDDWEAVRRVFHDAVDRAIDSLRDIRAKPVWLPTPEATKEKLRSRPPRAPEPLEHLLSSFAQDILPYGAGNIHPRFFGWVHGSGNVAGALGEMLAAFMNANVGGRDHVAVYVERQVIDWCKAIFSYPASSSGILTTGTSMATVIALAVARYAKSGAAVRKEGVAAARPFAGYASSEAHGSVAKAFDLLGLGQAALRSIAIDGDFRLRLDALERQVAQDRAEGRMPAIVVASCGTVNTGAIDDLAAIAAFCRAEQLWLHVDGAFGALAVLVPEFRATLSAIAEADSIAFDFHKWLHVPYDAGCVLVKDAAAHRATFASRPDYLAPAQRGLAGGDPWYCDYGPELSRGFRALKVWFTLKAHGIDRLAAAIARNCRQAKMVAEKVSGDGDLELLAPVALNIVCFRFRAPGLTDAASNRLNEEIVADLQEQGIAAPSTAKIAGRTAIRVCLTNHRTSDEDLLLLLAAVRRLGGERLARAERR